MLYIWNPKDYSVGNQDWFSIERRGKQNSRSWDHECTIHKENYSSQQPKLSATQETNTKKEWEPMGLWSSVFGYCFPTENTDRPLIIVWDYLEVEKQA